MSTHRFVKSDGSTLPVTMIGQQQVNAAKYDLALVQPPGGLQALAAGTGKPAAAQPKADFLITASTQTGARIAASDLYAFAKDATYLERYLPDGTTLQVLALSGGGESVASKAVQALSPSGFDFKVSLTFRPNVALLDPLTYGGATVTRSGAALTVIGA